MSRRNLSFLQGMAVVSLIWLFTGLVSFWLVQ